MCLRDALSEARRQLASALRFPLAEAGLEAQILLRHVLGEVSRAWLITHEEQVLTPEQQQRFTTLLNRRLAGEPVAYLLGYREFFGMKLTVTPDVLIPRPDTETLVEAALRHIPESQPCRVLDLGTGSGAIAIAMALQRLHASVFAVDRSEGAVAVARDNAARLQAERVTVLQSDWYASLGDMRFDVIVSNPPYIAEADSHLGRGDLRFEPRGALASGVEGLDDIRRIIAGAETYLVTGGWLLFEHGYDQADPVADLMSQSGFEDISHVNDLAGIRRVTQGRLRKP
jgi:release factor glutamine methyltransferase